jgi:hypothetical protein
MVRVMILRNPKGLSPHSAALLMNAKDKHRADVEFEVPEKHFTVLITG